MIELGPVSQSGWNYIPPEISGVDIQLCIIDNKVSIEKSHPLDAMLEQPLFWIPTDSWERGGESIVGLSWSPRPSWQCPQAILQRFCQCNFSAILACAAGADKFPQYHAEDIGHWPLSYTKTCNMNWTHSATRVQILYPPVTSCVTWAIYAHIWVPFLSSTKWGQ